jgi:hypothetical protein
MTDAVSLSVFGVGRARRSLARRRWVIVRSGSKMNSTMDHYGWYLRAFTRKGPPAIYGARGTDAPYQPRHILVRIPTSRIAAISTARVESYREFQFS